MPFGNNKFGDWQIRHVTFNCQIASKKSKCSSVIVVLVCNVSMFLWLQERELKRQQAAMLKEQVSMLLLGLVLVQLAVCVYLDIRLDNVPC